MDQSIFMDKTTPPTLSDLKDKLGETFPLWQNISKYVLSKYPKAIESWNFSGEKYGWSFRMKDTKRAIVYLLPRDKFFKVAFVFGQKATDAILQTEISDAIKVELLAANVYAEGRRIRIDIRKDTILDDIMILVDIKLANWKRNHTNKNIFFNEYSIRK